MLCSEEGSAFGLNLLGDLFHYETEKRLPDRVSECTGSSMHGFRNG